MQKQIIRNDLGVASILFSVNLPVLHPIQSTFYLVKWRF